MNKIDFRTAHYFPWNFVLISPVLMIIGGALLTMHNFWGVLLVLAGLLFLTTHYRFQIDESKKEYREYLWLLGYKKGPKTKYRQIEGMFVTMSKMKQTVNSRVSSMTVHKDVFNGFIKFDSENKVHLLTRNKKQNLINKLKTIANALNTQLKDYTEE